MKFKSISILTLLGLLCFSICGRAQSIFPITFKGSRQILDGSGRIVSQPVNNKTLLQEAATATGQPDVNSLTLVYDIGGDLDGDLIKVVNTNSTSVYTNLALKYAGDFGDSFGGSITNGDQTQITRVVEIIPVPLQSAEDLGHAIINERALLDKNGNFKKLLLTGNGVYFKTNTLGVTEIYNASFVSTGKPLAP
jgi:hypothetical protein